MIDFFQDHSWHQHSKPSQSQYESKHRPDQGITSYLDLSCSSLGSSLHSNICPSRSHTLSRSNSSRDMSQAWPLQRTDSKILHRQALHSRWLVFDWIDDAHVPCIVLHLAPLPRAHCRYMYSTVPTHSESAHAHHVLRFHSHFGSSP